MLFKLTIYLLQKKKRIKYYYIKAFKNIIFDIFLLYPTDVIILQSYANETQLLIFCIFLESKLRHIHTGNLKINLLDQKLYIV